ncbi:EamA-like transporter family protein [Marinobacter persicus]|uniref:EamA-like transporter family protein n=1 Tax=Marinobacter persicus TaxID=930118 RepID=A0A1I3W691_9GAMM|nr:DMT family transporter [Marinobacter persicus]GHD46890.1 integral membrane protein [Marinobacter persicus]SFK03098.1 EamA-like transporter family protein [Marinobacter persicus]
MNNIVLAGLVIIFSIVWSSAFIAGAIALSDFDPFTLLTIRFSLSALLMLPFCLGGESMHDRIAIKRGLLLGILNNALYLGLSFAALQTVRPQVVIVIVSCAPLATGLLSAWSGVEPLSPMKLFGATLGLSGVVVISGVAEGMKVDIWGILMAAAGMLAFASGTVFFRGRAVNLPVFQANFWQSVAGAAALLPMALVFGQPLAVPSTNTMIAVAHLVFIVTIGGMSLWLVLIRISGAATASTYHLLNPFFGVLLAYLVLGEQLRTTDFIGATLIVIGLILTTQERWRKAQC